MMERLRELEVIDAMEIVLSILGLKDLNDWTFNDELREIHSKLNNNLKR